MKSQLAKIGVEMTVEVPDHPAFIKRQFAGEFDQQLTQSYPVIERGERPRLFLSKARGGLDVAWANDAKADTLIDHYRQTSEASQRQRGEELLRYVAETPASWGSRPSPSSMRCTTMSKAFASGAISSSSSRPPGWSAKARQGDFSCRSSSFLVYSRYSCALDPTLTDFPLPWHTRQRVGGSAMTFEGLWTRRWPCRSVEAAWPIGRLNASPTSMMAPTKA
jgi:hypothetical protein